MQKWLPSILSAGLAGLSIFAQPLQSVISSHPAVAMSLAAAYAVLTHLMQSPVQGTNNQQ